MCSVVFDSRIGIMNSKIIIKTLVSNFRTLRNLSTTQSCQNLPPNSVMNVFDRKTKFLQRERAAKDPEVKLYDYIKDEVGYRLADRIFDVKRVFECGLDLGCGRGHVSKNVLSDCVKKIILADMSPTYLEQAEVGEGIQVERKILDEENFVFDEETLDIVISCLSLHWVNDLPGCFGNIIKSLKKDGVFMGAVFGGDTLYELR